MREDCVEDARWEIVEKMRNARTMLVAAMSSIFVGCGASPSAGSKVANPASAPMSVKSTASPATPKAPPRPSVQTVAWRDRTYELSPKDLGEMMAGTYQVKDGVYNWDRGDGDHGWFFVSHPEYGDVDGDGYEEAVLIMTWNGGGSGHFSVGVVYGYVDGELVVRARVPGGDRADGGLRDIGVIGGAIVVERNQSQQGACCPDGLVKERWVWIDGSLEEDELARERE